MYLFWRDDWPVMPDGSDFDGKDLLALVRGGNSPFDGVWDVNLLIQEIEGNLGSQVIDILTVNKGSNNYGFDIKLSNQLDIVARLSRGDVNMPNFSGFPIESQVEEVKFEVAVYRLLRSEPRILVSRLLYHRIPVEYEYLGHSLDPPQDIAGRRLFLFEKAEGEKDVWRELSPDQQDCLLVQAASIRASLYGFNLPQSFADLWLRDRLFQHSSEQNPGSFSVPIGPTREFCIAMFESKIRAMIPNLGDKMGFEDDNYTVTPIVAAAKRSLLRVLPYILPADISSSRLQPTLYRLVLEHGDFGIHNMSITFDANQNPLVTSLYDWEAGNILPAILSDPMMSLYVDLIEDKNGAFPLVSREDEFETPKEHAEHMRCARVYFKALYEQEPSYRRVIQVGKDARYLWFALQGWLAEQPDEYFGSLGAWAERKLKKKRRRGELLNNNNRNRGGSGGSGSSGSSAGRPRPVCSKCGF